MVEMSGGTGDGLGMPKLVKAEYERWAKLAKSVLKGRKLWSIIEKGYVPIDRKAEGITPERIAEDDKNEADNANALAMLQHATIQSFRQDWRH